jgi:hypothetical protein
LLNQEEKRYFPTVQEMEKHNKTKAGKLNPLRPMTQEESVDAVKRYMRLKDLFERTNDLFTKCKYNSALKPTVYAQLLHLILSNNAAQADRNALDAAYKTRGPAKVCEFIINNIIEARAKKLVAGRAEIAKIKAQLAQEKKTEIKLKLKTYLTQLEAKVNALEVGVPEKTIVSGGYGLLKSALGIGLIAGLGCLAKKYLCDKQPKP